MRCPDGSEGYVRWTDTLLGATTLRRADGGALRRQQVAVECDSPYFAEWRLDAQGVRIEPFTIVQPSGGC